jgi:hypothetical protein
MKVDISTTVSLTPNWHLAAISKIASVGPFSAERRDQCRVTILNIYVTDRVMRATSDVLAKQLTELDARIAALDARGRFEQWWRLLERPVRIGTDIWLVLDPTMVRLGRIRANNERLDATVGLTVTPRIVTGLRPPEVNRPIPRLEMTGGFGDSLHLLVAGDLSYDVARSAVVRALRGKRLRQGTRHITIRDVQLSGIGDGRLAVAVSFDGSAVGRIYLVGTPRYNPERDELYVPDLDFDLASENVLVRGLEWLKHEELRDTLRQRARWPARSLVETAMRQVQRGINRELARGVQLSGTLREGAVIDVLATPAAFVVHAHADGQLALRVNRSPFKRLLKRAEADSNP